MTIYTMALTLFFVMDPLGNIPIYLSILKTVDERRRKFIVFREAIIALVILVFLLYCGHYVLVWMNLSTAALSVAGGIILFFIAIKMIFPPDEEHEIKQKGEPFIVPLAVPLVAGPSAMAMVMLLNTENSNASPVLLALIIAWVVTTVILMLGESLRSLLGEKGLIALERLMGMILTTMAVQMFLTGIAAFFHLAS